MHEKPPEVSAPARIRAVLLPNCREMCRHVSRALDASLPWWQRPGVGLHLLFCRLCRRYRAQLRWLHRAARTDRAAESPRDRLPAGIRSRWIHSLQLQLRETAANGPDSTKPAKSSPP